MKEDKLTEQESWLKKRIQTRKQLTSVLPVQWKSRDFKKEWVQFLISENFWGLKNPHIEAYRNTVMSLFFLKQCLFFFRILQCKNYFCNCVSPRNDKLPVFGKKLPVHTYLSYNLSDIPFASTACEIRCWLWDCFCTITI